MTDTLVVRAAVMTDINVLIEFNAAMALETEHKVLDPAVLSAGVAAVIAEPKRGFYLVAEHERAVVGCLMITYEWSDWRNGDWWWFQSVYVRPDYRRRGVFRKLYEEVERLAQARPDVVGLRLYVERDNAHAQRTYESLGMSESAYRLYAKAYNPQAAG